MEGDKIASGHWEVSGQVGGAPGKSTIVPSKSSDDSFDTPSTVFGPYKIDLETL